MHGVCIFIAECYLWPETRTAVGALIDPLGKCMGELNICTGFNSPSPGGLVSVSVCACMVVCVIVVRRMLLKLAESSYVP